MVPGQWPLRVIDRLPSQGTGPTGSNIGDVLIDNNGNRWIVTGGHYDGTIAASQARLYPDGTIR